MICHLHLFLLPKYFYLKFQDILNHVLEGKEIFDEEIKKNEEVEDVQFEEVSKQEVVQSVEQENEEQS